MDRFMLQAIVAEFWFLGDLIGDRDPTAIDSVELKRLDSELLESTPHYSGATGSLVGIDEGTQVHLILEPGKMLKDAVKDAGSCVHNEAHRDNESWDGETILEAIDRHDVGDQISYIVKERYGYKIRDHHSIGGRSYTIYKAGKDKLIADYLAEASQKAIEAVKTQLDF